MELLDIIVDYYEGRGLKFPDTWQSLAFLHTEIAEVYELLLARDGGFVRNHPENKPEFNKEDLATELADCLMMIMVCGYVEGVNPIQALKDKIARKLESIKSSKES